MISEHFSEEELVVTDSGLPNECPEEYLPNAKRLAEEVLEPARVLVGPMGVNSWFRCESVNRHAGGDPNSAHKEARAADCVPRGNVLNAFKMIVASDIPFDKIIYEKHNSEWLHMQVRQDGPARRLAFTAHRENGKMVYVRFDG